jgi:hypothetical protein
LRIAAVCALGLLFLAPGRAVAEAEFDDEPSAGVLYPTLQAIGNGFLGGADAVD